MTSSRVTLTHLAVPLALAALATGCLRGAAPGPTAPRSATSLRADSLEVAGLDETYQAAVKANDAIAMGRILADDFALVTGRGATFSREDLLREARESTTVYERQDVVTRSVRVWDNTAVVTALLWIKGVRGGRPVEYRLWFSDTYVRTAAGWRYVLGQASLPLPAEPARP